jgi:ABC-type Zn uptake system ZnuABC Zn-binding protein ZnuA
MYLLLNVKRNQRTIPVIEKPKNESLDFVKTIGKLYYEKQDHLNLAQKMCTYFLEHIRSKYFINTSNLNNTFIEQLSGKSGVTQAEVEQLVSSIQAIQIANQISQQQLNFYYQQFNQFYKNTA